LEAGHPCEDLEDKSGRNPLHAAAFLGRGRVVDAMLAGCTTERALLHRPGHQHGGARTPAQEAASMGHDEIADRILTHAGQKPTPVERFGGAGEGVAPREASVGTGGWKQGTGGIRDSVDTTRCDVERLDLATTSRGEIIARIRHGVPFILKGGVPKDHKAWATFKKEAFVAQNSGLEVTVSKIPYGDQFGIFSKRTSLNKYVRMAIDSKKGPKVPVYVFAELFESHGPAPFGKEGLLFPSWLSKNATQTSYQFYLGPPGSGAPVHFHDNAINFLMYGRKRWFMFRPGDTNYMRTAPLSWFHAEDGYKRAKEEGTLVECVQQPGEAIFVPQAWGHGVLNIETSIGAAMEFVPRETHKTGQRLSRQTNPSQEGATFSLFT